MIKILLPVIKSSKVVDGKYEVEYGEKEFKLDFTLTAQMRWEQKFPSLSEKEDLEMYTERISKVESFSSAVIISKLKTIYCYFDTDISFIEFLQLFDLSNPENNKKVIDKIAEVFQAVFDNASEKN